MAAIQKVDPIFVAPPGMEVIDSGLALEAMEAGDPIIIDSAPNTNRLYTATVKKATGTEAHGICLKTVGKGGHAEYACQGEMDGFAGLTPGSALSIASGAIDTTAPSGTPQIRVVNPSRIRFVLV